MRHLEARLDVRLLTRTTRSAWYRPRRVSDPFSASVRIWRRWSGR
ncbi:hypothetical protein LNP17_16855 [Klebsiella variicola subsp. variicola]|nr:hypothetical protein [Klebsiella variicola subsp. variicola]